MNYQFYTADVFTTQPFGGNQLAVIPDATGLNSTQMQQIAREFNLSETVFVFPPDQAQHTRRLRIFTPASELPFAGHPTVGAAYVLATIGDIQLSGALTAIVFEEGVGPVPVTIQAEDGKPTFAVLSAARLPEIGPPPPDIATLALVLSLDATDLLDGHYAPQAVSCGVPFLFVPVRDRAALGRAQLSHELWKRTLAHTWAPQLFVFAFDPELPGSHLRARMFAPSMGIVEDPATGAAATALGGYLALREAPGANTLHWRVEQGFEMGRPSILEVEVDRAATGVTAVRVGGASVLISEGTLKVFS